MQSYALLLECALRRGKLRFIAEAALAAVEARLAGTAFTVRAAVAFLTERTLLAVVLAIRTIFAVLAERALLAVVLAIRTGFAVLAERALLAVVLAIRTVTFLAERALIAVGFTVRTLILIVLPIGTLLSGRLTVGALRLLLCRFFGLDRRFLGLFRLILMLFDALRDWIFTFFSLSCCATSAYAGSCSASLFTAAAAIPMSATAHIAQPALPIALPSSSLPCGSVTHGTLALSA